jgi:hypothetical protein
VKNAELQRKRSRVRKRKSLKRIGRSTLQNTRQKHAILPRALAGKRQQWGMKPYDADFQSGMEKGYPNQFSSLASIVAEIRWGRGVKKALARLELFGGANFPIDGLLQHLAAYVANGRYEAQRPKGDSIEASLRKLNSELRRNPNNDGAKTLRKCCLDFQSERKGSFLRLDEFFAIRFLDACHTFTDKPLYSYVVTLLNSAFGLAGDGWPMTAGSLRKLSERQGKKFANPELRSTYQAHVQSDTEY